MKTLRHVFIVVGIIIFLGMIIACDVPTDEIDNSSNDGQDETATTVIDVDFEEPQDPEIPQLNKGLTINDLSRNGDYVLTVHVFNNKADISTYTAIKGANNSENTEAVGSAYSGNLFALNTWEFDLAESQTWDGSGEFPVLLIDPKGSITNSENPYYRIAKVSFNKGSGTADFSDFSAVVSTITNFVLFDPNGGNWNGEKTIKAVMVEKHTAVVLPEPPKWDRRYFDGWTTLGGAEFNFTAPITDTVTLYARWKFYLPLTNVDDVIPYLASAQPYEHESSMGLLLPLKTDLGDLSGTSDLWKVIESLWVANKSVNLDLSKCSMNGTDFNPRNAPETLFYRSDFNGYYIDGVYRYGIKEVYIYGWEKIIAITLPDAVISLSQRWYKGGLWGGNGPTLRSFSAKNLKSLPAYAFGSSMVTGDCTGIEYIDVPAITSIGERAFYNCRKLKLTVLPEGVKTVGSYAFMGCPDVTLSILPAGLEMIGDGAFRNTEVTLTSLPAGLTSIGGGALAVCTGITQFTLPIGIDSVSSNLFAYCENLSQIVIPAGVKSIGMYAFRDCTSLTQVICLEATPPSLELNAFENTHPNLSIKVPAASVNAYKNHYPWSTYASRISGI